MLVLHGNVYYAQRNKEKYLTLTINMKNYKQVQCQKKISDSYTQYHCFI